MTFLEYNVETYTEGPANFVETLFEGTSTSSPPSTQERDPVWDSSVLKNWEKLVGKEPRTLKLQKDVKTKEEEAAETEAPPDRYIGGKFRLDIKRKVKDINFK